MTPATMPGISLAAVPDQFNGAVGFTVAEGSDWTGALAALDAACGGAIKRTAEAAGFDGSKGKTLLVLGNKCGDRMKSGAKAKEEKETKKKQKQETERG